MPNDIVLLISVFIMLNYNQNMENLCDSIYSKDFFFFKNLTYLKRLNPKFEYNVLLKLVLFIAIVSLPQWFALHLTKDNQSFAVEFFVTILIKANLNLLPSPSKNRFRQQLFFWCIFSDSLIKFKPIDMGPKEKPSLR